MKHNHTNMTRRLSWPVFSKTSLDVYETVRALSEDSVPSYGKPLTPCLHLACSEWHAFMWLSSSSSIYAYNWSQRELLQPLNISLYKISPELNKGAVCFSTTDSSCHLPSDEALLVLQHLVTSDGIDFTNSILWGPNYTDNPKLTQTHYYMILCCSTSWIWEVVHL